MPTFSFATAGFGFGGANLSVSAAGEISYANSGADLIVTTTDPDWPGSYTITAAQLAALASGSIVFLAYRAPTGAATAGNTITARTPLVVWRTIDGEPDLVLAWSTGGASLGKTVTAEDEASGLSIAWTASNLAGAFNGAQEVLAAQTYQTWVRQVGDSYLTPPAGTVLEDDWTQGVLFVSFRVGQLVDWDLTGASQRPFELSGDVNDLFIRMNTGGVNGGLYAPRIRLTDGSGWGAAGTDYRGQDVNLLMRFDHSGTTAAALRFGSGSWATGSLSGGGASAPGEFFFGAQAPQIFHAANQDGLEIRRFAFWQGVTVDPTDTAVQGQFVSAGGGLVDPATSVASLGTPRFDFYGLASEWNAGTTNGSVSAFTATGSFEAT